jgi:vacuolar-type H+-ATPase subunit E/Vma4
VTTSTLAPRGAPTPIEEALAPLHGYLVAAAEQEAAQVMAQAEASAGQAVDDARTQAEQMRAQARDEGERDAQVVRRDQSARARRRARGVVLAAQSAALSRLRHAVAQRLRQAWDDPQRHDTLLRRLTDLAHAELGDDCDVDEHPDGGVVAVRDGTRVPFLLGDLADDAIDDAAGSLERLWSP